MANELKQDGNNQYAFQEIHDSTIIIDSSKPNHPCTIPFMAEPLGEFVQRPAEFDALRKLLLDEDRSTPVAITAALRGAGGFGKTTLARALCHDPQVRAAFADGILWVTLGENPTNILGSVEDLIFTLEGERPGFTNVQTAANRLKELLTNRAALLVIDDVWNNAHLTPFMQGGERCAYLITTRNSDTLPAQAKPIPVDAMQQREAVALLAAGIDAAEPHQDQLLTLAKRLGEWPLLLKLVNGTLRDRVNNTRADLAVAIEYANRALDKRGLTFFDVRNAEARHQAVALTLGISLDLLTDDERVRYRALAVFPEDVEIPLPTLEKYWGLDDFSTEEICTRLMQMSLLLSYDATAQRIRLHDIVRHFLIGQQSDQMPTLHQKLLDSHRPVALSPDLPVWSALPDDEPYLWEHLAQHLIEAGRGDELVATVKDWRYLAKKTFLRKSHAVEKDLLAAEKIAPADDPLRPLRRSFVNSGHLFNRCALQEDVKETLYVRLQHLRELKVICPDISDHLKIPRIEPQSILPDLPHPNLIRTLEGPLRGVTNIALSAAGNLIISASKDKTVKVWDAVSGEPLLTLEGHTDWVNDCKFSPNGKLIISASRDNTLRIWDALTGELHQTLEGHLDSVNGCAISPNGNLIVSASSDCTLRLWNTNIGELQRTLEGHLGSVNACAYSLEENLIVSASSDKTLRVWNADTGELQRTLEGHLSKVTDCAFSLDGTLIISTSGDRTIKIWETSTGELLRTLVGHSSRVIRCAVSKDGKLIASASSDNTLRVWDVMTGELLNVLEGHAGKVTGCAFSPDTKLIISGSNDRSLKVWGTEIVAPPLRPKGFPRWLKGCALSSTRKRMASVSSNYALLLWNAVTGELELKLEGHKGGINGCAFSPNERLVASASSDCTLKLWDAVTGVLLLTINGHSRWIRGCTFSPDGRLIVSASGDSTLKVWDVATGELQHTLDGHLGEVNCCAVSPNGKLIVSASSDRKLNVWDIETGKLKYTLNGHSDCVNSCTFSPDGTLIASASGDHTLKIWNVGDSQLIRTLEGHKAGVRSCVFTSDGNLVISVSRDYTLKLWNTVSGKNLATFYADGPLEYVTVSSDWVVADGVRGIYFLRLRQ